MTARVERSSVKSHDGALRVLMELQLTPSEWSNEPGYVYGRHDHDYHKVLYCVRGSITFHTNDGDIELSPGDRLDIDPHTDHAATVGPEGVTCIEAAIS